MHVFANSNEKKTVHYEHDTLLWCVYQIETDTRICTNIYLFDCFWEVMRIYPQFANIEHATKNKKKM